MEYTIVRPVQIDTLQFFAATSSEQAEFNPLRVL
jgi:hypothetical protein